MKNPGEYLYFSIVLDKQSEIFVWVEMWVKKKKKNLTQPLDRGTKK